MTNKNERIAGLDVVRAIAVLSVVCAHSFGILKPLLGDYPVGIALSFIGDHILPFAGLGVELFFVLSGFLIGNILIRDFIHAERFSFNDVKHFWIRRWFRTLPNYWLILSANIILYSVLHLQPLFSYQWVYYFFLQNLVHPPPVFFFNESWSLSIEEWFYLTLPLVMLVASALFSVKKKGRFLLNVFTGYLLLFLVIRFINAFHPINGPAQDEGIRKIVLFRLDAVMYGVLFAWLNYYKSALLHRYRKSLLAVSLIGAAILYFLLSKRTLHISDSPFPIVRFLSDAFLFTIQPLVLALCLPYARSVLSLRSPLLSSTTGFISRISYSMYLIHYSLIFLPFFYKLNTASTVTTILYYILYWLIVIGLSAIIYRYFELPVMKLRNRFN